MAYQFALHELLKHTKMPYYYYLVPCGASTNISQRSSILLVLL